MQNQVYFYPETFYHIYNRGIDTGNLFFNKDNYNYFMHKYEFYLKDFIDLYAYCLLPNHFHFLIKVKSEGSIKNLPGFQNLEGFNCSKLISKAFSNLFNSYAKAVNKQQKRKGSLFQKNFRKKNY